MAEYILNEYALNDSNNFHEADRKKRKLSGDERLNRNRERNRIHARKTRERKRSQTMALQGRIKELFEEGSRLRQIIDETYTASSLLGLAHHNNESLVEEVDKAYMPSSSICPNYYAEVFPSEIPSKDSFCLDVAPSPSSKRIRRSGKYSQQERDKIRRERNRMHAKKTRDRKKQFLEMSEKVISEMESEAFAMRKYLRSLNLITDEEISQSLLRDSESKMAIEQMKRESHTVQGGEEDDEDEDDEDIASTESSPRNTRSPQDKESRSQSSGEDNEKTSSCDFNSNTDDSGAGSSSRTHTTNSSASLNQQNYTAANLATLEYKGDNQGSGSDDKQSDSGNTNSGGSDYQDRESPDCNNCEAWQGDEYRKFSSHESYRHSSSL